MDYIPNDQLYKNSLNFKRALDRIAAKYSKLQNEEGAIEVDLSNIRLTTLNTYMNSSRNVLNKLESKSLTDLHEESLNTGQDVTGNSQLDFTYNDGGEKTCSSTSEFAGEETTEDEHEQEVMLSSLNETYRVLSDSEIQPEDQDEELQTSLSSHGSSLVDIYPSMVSRIERAWHRQHVSEAANSVLRRYRRWRQQPKRSSFNSTFDVTLRNTNRNRMRSPSTEMQEDSGPVKRARLETTPRSVRPVSPPKSRASPRPVLVMDFSEKPKEMPLQDTFIVPELSPQPEEHVSINTAGPSHPSYISAKSAINSSFREKKPYISAHSAESSTYTRDSPAGNKWCDIYSSPVRQSPLKTRVINAFSRSPHASSKSPQGLVLDRCSRESLKPASWSASLHGSPKRSVGQLKMLHHQDPHQVSSPWSARRGDGPRRFRRHLSFDSSLSRPVSHSPNKIDEDFTKVYHKFVCQNKSPYFNSHPCRLCARSSKVSQGFSSSSSSLEALALSPHRSILWRRHGELRSDSYLMSKRLREDCGENSPGSKRHRREMWGRRLSPSYSPSKLRIQQPASRQEVWMDQRRSESAADFPYSGRFK